MARFVFLTTVLTAIVAASAVIDYRSQGVEPPLSDIAAMPSKIAAPGVVEGATEEMGLRPEVAGVLVELLVAIGDRVQKDQPLLRLDDREARLRVESARADLASAVAQRDRLINGARVQERDEARALVRSAAARLLQAESSLGRVEHLEREAAVTEQEADDARSDVDSLRAELAAAEARLAQLEAPAREDEVRLADARIASAQAAVDYAELSHQKTTVRSPCDAQVLDFNAELGELIGPTSPTPTVVLADTSRLRVRAFVEELDAPRVMLGAPVTITADGLPEHTYEGRVVSLSPRMAAKTLTTGRPNELHDTKTREVMVEVRGGAGLIVGLRVDVSISTLSE
ncbi:HlyD family secretion protein [Botrimarina mediterranea]|uniref:HlyD family secretion protein n=1 Tax=Botrimarina mediterranea TaxID=2528022 RepID=UPI00118A3AF6|nr:Multidrug resistance protein MdtN [Planctomycetes bacterium K2D]